MKLPHGALARRHRAQRWPGYIAHHLFSPRHQQPAQRRASSQRSPALPKGVLEPYRGGVASLLFFDRPIGATAARQIPVLKVTRSNRVSVTEVWADLCRRYTHRSKDAPRSRRAKILACCAATVIFGPKASLFAGAAAVVTWSRHRAARVEAALGAAPTAAPTPAPVAMDPVGGRR